jgi:hypothetical protein
MPRCYRFRSCSRNPHAVCRPIWLEIRAPRPTALRAKGRQAPRPGRRKLGGNDKETAMKFLRSTAALIAVSACAALAPAHAADPAAQQRYQAERARCESGLSHQDRATCLREAGAALQESGKGGLSSLPNTEQARNAIERCNAHPVAERQACVQRVMGAGSAQGSVEGGGVIRQTETPVPRGGRAGAHAAVRPCGRAML